MKKYLFLLLLLPVLATAGRLQNEDFKTEAELTGAGGAVSQLLNDTKIYVTGSGINKTLDDAIADGDIGFQSPMTTNGDLIIYNSGDTRLAAGTNGWILTMVAGLPAWQAAPVSTTLTTKGDIQTYDTANASLAVGTDGTFLVADSSTATGLAYTDTLQGRLNPVTDWASFTPTGSWTNTTYTGSQRRVGDNLELIYNLSLTGLPTGGGLLLDIPDSLIIDENKLGFPNVRRIVGQSIVYDQDGPTKGGVTRPNNSTQLRVEYDNQSSGLSQVTDSGPLIYVSGDSLQIKAIVPIVGWTSGVDAVAQNKDMTREESNDFTVDVAANGTVTNEDFDWITGNCTHSGTGVYDCTLETGLFAVEPSIVGVNADGAGTCREIRVLPSGTVYFTINTFSSAGAAANCKFKLHARRAGTDSNKKHFIAAAIDSQKWECETKKLTANSTSVGSSITLSDLTMNNLVIGKKYFAHLQAHTNGAGGDTSATINHNSSVLASIRNRISATQLTMSASNSFVASATTLTVVNNSASGGIVYGANNFSSTWVKLCKLPDNYNLTFTGF